jgi:predicted Zn finger-like uncharacterized protein
VFTQCSKCETIFKLSADVLRAAGGQVRCGKCGEVFNALSHLAEDASAFSVSESALDLEVRADRILQSPPSAPAARKATGIEEFAPPGMEIARLQILEWSGDELSEGQGNAISGPADSVGEPAETSMEFTLPPGELDRIFVESKNRKRPVFPFDPIAEPASAKAAQPRPAQEPTEEPLDIEIISDRRDVSSGPFEVSEVIRREMLSELRSEQVPVALAQEPQARTFNLWLAAAIAAGLLLMAQVVHQNREWLSVHTVFGVPLQAFYTKLGAPIPQPANLSAYQLRQWGVTGDPAADGTLRVRASILNSAQQNEPYPLLRVKLANRFGSSVGSRDFEPAEYAGKPITKPLAPGERVDATMDILDPGKSAEGFEIDVCLRDADQRITCANDAAPLPANR